MSGAEKALFGTVTGTVGINFSAYEDIPVKRSGADSDKYPAMKTFQDAALAGVPLFLQRNINLCGYTTPTPVQKHAIPIAVAGIYFLSANKSIFMSKPLSFKLWFPLYLAGPYF